MKLNKAEIIELLFKKTYIKMKTEDTKIKTNSKY